MIWGSAYPTSQARAQAAGKKTGAWPPLLPSPNISPQERELTGLLIVFPSLVLGQG